MREKYRQLYRKQGFKLTLHFYDEKKKFSGSKNENLKRYLAQLTSLCDKSKTNDTTRLANFVHSLHPDSQVHQYYVKLKNGFLTWSSLTKIFKARYHSDTKRARAGRQLKAIICANY